MIKNILYVLLAVSLLLFGFTLGRFTEIGGVGGRTYKMVRSTNSLNPKEKRVAQAIIKKSPDMAQSFLKGLGKNAEDDEKFSKVMESFEKDPARGLAFIANKGQQREEEEPGKVYEVKAGNVPSKGPADAPITIVEFSDFQCPFCTKGYQTMKELNAKYPGKIRFEYVSKILPFHKKAPMAHAAAYAAGEQGKFWEFHDYAFENQSQLDDNVYTEWAKKLGLNVAKFQKDLNLEKYKPEFDRMDKLGNDLGVRGTPTFFINGIKVRGAKPTSEFIPIIDNLLAGKTPAEAAKPPG